MPTRDSSPPCRDRERALRASAPSTRDPSSRAGRRRGKRRSRRPGAVRAPAHLRSPCTARAEGPLDRIRYAFQSVPHARPGRRSPSSRGGVRAAAGARRGRTVSRGSRTTPSCPSSEVVRREDALVARYRPREPPADPPRMCSSRRRARRRLHRRVRPSRRRPRVVTRGTSAAPTNPRTARRTLLRARGATSPRPDARRARGDESRSAGRPAGRLRARRTTALRTRSRTCAAAPSSPRPPAQQGVTSRRLRTGAHRRERR